MPLFSGLGSADRQGYQDSQTSPNDDSDYILVKNTGTYVYYCVIRDGSKYIVQTDRSGEVQSVEPLSAQNEVSEYEVRVAERRAREMRTSPSVEAIDRTNYTGPDIIERADYYEDTFQSCTFSDYCFDHIISGISMEFNQTVAGMAKGAIAAAIIDKIAVVAGGTALASLFSAPTVRGALGAAGTQLAGNTLTLNIVDFDLDLVIDKQKLKNQAVSVGSWKPGPDEAMTFATVPGHYKSEFC